MAEHSIGKTIADLRKAKGWTQVELAEQLNVSDKTISKWESEAGYPEITMFPRLADLFDVSIDYLMTGKEVQPKIITMSKAELCAKNDDVTLLKEIGFDVADFRGGESQRFFATRRNVKELLSFDGINSFTIEGYNDFTAANEVLSYAEQNVEYLLIAGKHAAIVRRGETGFEYLELQSPTNNGYHQLTKAELKDRFGCQKSHTVYGNKLKSSSHLVRVDSFGNSKAFIKALGYLNTVTQNQQKGESGSVK